MATVIFGSQRRWPDRTVPYQISAESDGAKPHVIDRAINRLSTEHRSRPIPRYWTSLLATLFLTTGLFTALQLTIAAPASALTGRIVGYGASVNDSSAVKTVPAFCPQNTRVVGGGGWIQEAGTPKRIGLTQLRPVFLYNGHVDAYLVTGAETTPGTTTNWQLHAYAVCISHRQGLHIVTASTPYSSNSVQATAAACPAGFRVFGTGALVSPANGQAVLQVARPSGPGDIARAQGHEDIDGYSGSWAVTSFAICGYAPPGYAVIFGRSIESASESQKTANTTCPSGTNVLSAGAATSDVAPAGTSLQLALPNGDSATAARAVENATVTQNWDYIVATAICASSGNV